MTYVMQGKYGAPFLVLVWPLVTQLYNLKNFTNDIKRKEEGNFEEAKGEPKELKDKINKSETKLMGKNGLEVVKRKLNWVN